MKKIYQHGCLCFLFIMPAIAASSQYKGGIGQGTIVVKVAGAALGNNIYAGGVDDGTAITKSTAVSLGANIYLGGIDDGITNSNATKTNLGANIYTGGADDGNTVNKVIAANLGTNIFTGGAGDGFTSFKAANADAGANIFKGGAGDGWAMTFKSQVALPVTLTNFTGKWLKTDAQLDWQTLTEINTDHFTLERSFNAINFTAIANINAAGQSTTTQSYRYTDVNIPAVIPQGQTTVYYRLHTFDKDGNATYSGIVVLHTVPVTLAEYAVFPNPAKDVITITTTAPLSTEKTYIRFADATGKVLVLQQMSSPTQQVTVSNYAAGLYYLQLITADKVLYTQKIIINK